MTNAISNIVDDKRYIKSELTTDSSVKKVPFFFASEHKVTNDIVKQEVKTYNGGVNQFILNSSALGVLGTNKLGDGSEWSFVWGSDTRGEWGTQRWGDDGSTIALRYVQPTRNLFKEPFEDSEFIKSTGGTIANSIITLDNAESLISETFWKNPTVTPQSISFTEIGGHSIGDNPMALGTLALGTTLFGPTIDLEVSADAGNTWTPVSTLSSHPLPSNATELRYKVISNADGITFDNIEIKINI